MTAAAESAGNGRDSAGRFVPGHRLGGRPRGVDLRALVEHRAAADPSLGSLDAVVWRVTRALLAEAEAGNVAAGKVLLDYLVADADALPPVESRMSDREVAERLAIILRDAAARRALEQGRPTASEGALLGGLA